MAEQQLYYNPAAQISTSNVCGYGHHNECTATEQEHPCECTCHQSAPVDPETEPTYN